MTIEHWPGVFLSEELEEMSLQLECEKLIGETAVSREGRAIGLLNAKEAERRHATSLSKDAG